MFIYILQEWQPFPERWYSEGKIVPMDGGSSGKTETSQSSVSQDSNTEIVNSTSEVD